MKKRKNIYIYIYIYIYIHIYIYRAPCSARAVPRWSPERARIPLPPRRGHSRPTKCHTGRSSPEQSGQGCRHHHRRGIIYQCKYIHICISLSIYIDIMYRYNVYIYTYVCIYVYIYIICIYVYDVAREGVALRGAAGLTAPSSARFHISMYLSLSLALALSLSLYLYLYISS